MAFPRIEYMCTHCGKKEIRNTSMGRPLPGKCPKREGNKPHVWIKNRNM